MALKELSALSLPVKAPSQEWERGDNKIDKKTNRQTNKNNPQGPQ